MRLVPTAFLLAAAFGAGAAVAGYVHQRPPAAAAARAAPPVRSGPDAGERDPAADLRDQMQWDPNTRTYQGG